MVGALILHVCWRNTPPYRGYKCFLGAAVAHLFDIEKVTGSTPVGSTNFSRYIEHKGCKLKWIGTGLLILYIVGSTPTQPTKFKEM